MVLRTVLTALLALRALSSASLALSDACGTAERVRVNWFDRFYLGAWFGEGRGLERWAGPTMPAIIMSRSASAFFLSSCCSAALS